MLGSVQNFAQDKHSIATFNQAHKEIWTVNIVQQKGHYS